ncbi:glycogen/starch/alpha-glucan phosphorylase [Hydrogenimonas cancrithermarum]|uniref:Glycogen phosphorylase n=1 Tax=Hydrogenimonas cancrithermarum TaxID=2993563 RepID=A0ABN6WSI7_9BACT|nr:glycogen/starch/alpha-glucan phosphorylase [Hydrogenimonas cancrithermarum]BDY11776.1 hypothetical protein HCR_00880 [Hydrogenimonas cancrithermarum]
MAYFCTEFGLHHTLPIYSGGFGFLAGDILKETSDMGLPMVGVGFMYPQGYVRQVIGSDGWQQGANETIDKDCAPIERNDPWDRQISSHLYTPDMNQGLRQQIVLGIGGYRMLEEIGIEYSILHLNEGHPTCVLFERVRVFIEDGGLSLDEAIEKVKRTSIFTTHTPLQAATEVYSFNMMSNYFEDYRKRLGHRWRDVKRYDRRRCALRYDRASDACRDRQGRNSHRRTDSL